MLILFVINSLEVLAIGVNDICRLNLKLLMMGLDLFVGGVLFYFYFIFSTLIYLMVIRGSVFISIILELLATGIFHSFCLPGDLVCGKSAFLFIGLNVVGQERAEITDTFITLQFKLFINVNV